MKHKRVWTDAQRKAAGDRLREAQKLRWVKTAITDPKTGDVLQVQNENPSRRDPEIQAVVDSMTPERRAKLEMVQAQSLARMAETREGQAALARFESAKIEAPFSAGPAFGVTLTPTEQNMIDEGLPPPPPRIGTREVNLIVRTDGTMVSQYGPCICGAAKRQWHKICATPEAEPSRV